ncbi:MAG: replicative DNA helicase [Clostridia bacterium]|nr:replicative DNA helicase [Clostridia bacterium]
MELPIGKTMPYNIEAEQAVLGSMIFDANALSVVMEKLSADDFYTNAHKTIFTAASKVYNSGAPLDMVTLSDTLGTDIESVGGISYISKIVQNVLTTENLNYYIDIVEAKSLLRRLIDAAGEIIDMSVRDEESVSAILEQSEKLIFSIVQKRGTKGFYHIGEVIKSAMALLEELKKRGGKITGVPTGFDGLDALTAGLQNSNLVIIAARPGVGKTSLALNIAENAAIRNRVPVAIFSLEMSKEELVNRVLSSEALIPSQKMRVGDLDANDMAKLAHSLKSLVSAPIYIDDTPGITASEIRAKSRRMKIEHNIGLIIIDYLQLMESHSKRDSRAQEVTEISRALKIMAKELCVPVVTLSQLNRASEARKDRRPQMSDLRESGSIEQDADIVMLLYNPESGEEEPENAGVIECIVAKNRGGECKSVNLAWRGEYTKFTNLDMRSGG